VGIKAVPVYFANYELQDRMETEARFAVVNRKSPDEVRDVVFREAQARDIPVAREDIKVESNERGVRISVNYTVTLDLRVYQWQLHFNPRADSRTL
jgi:folylpolyglutamate synthase/dihydropteroate synthase